MAILFMIFSIVVYFINIGNRELYLLFSLLFLVIVFLFKYLK